MKTYPIQRAQILDAIQRELEPLDFVHAMWEAGAASFARVDEWSDIDLMVDVDDDHVAEIFTRVEKVLEHISAIELKYVIPQPSFFDIDQAFYRLRDASPFLLLDLAVIRHSHPNKLLEPEIHGQARVLFDKSGVVGSAHLNGEELQARLEARRSTLRTTFDLWQVLVLKEINRRNTIEALVFYYGYTLRPLVEMLRIQHLPARYSFYTRYIHYDLPDDAVRRLEKLFFVANADELAQKHREAVDWFNWIVVR